MSCEKYSGWITDTALGELRAEREPELQAHAMECAACREALGHARALDEFVTRGVQALVAGEPSPQFATNLRRRIAQESEPPRFPWMAWAPVLAGALALAVVLAITVARRPVQTRSNPSIASTVNPVSAPQAASTASVSTPQNPARTRSQRDSNRGTTPRPVTTTLPEIIVPKGQLSAAAQLSAAISSGRVDGNQLLAVQQEHERPLAVKPIEIAPLEIPTLADATEKPANSIQF